MLFPKLKKAKSTIRNFMVISSMYLVLLTFPRPVQAQFKNWYDLLHIDPNKFHFLKSDVELDDIDYLISTIFVLAFAGLFLAFIFIVIYGGSLWTTSGDNQERLEKAKKVIKNGLIAIFMVFVFLMALGIIAGILGITIAPGAFISRLL